MGLGTQGLGDVETRVGVVTGTQGRGTRGCWDVGLRDAGTWDLGMRDTRTSGRGGGGGETLGDLKT